MKSFVTDLFVFIQMLACKATIAQVQDSCPCRIPIDNTFQIAPMTKGPDVGIPPLFENNDAATPAIALPFHFCFYGQSFDSVYISNNGIVSFKQPIYKFDTSGLFPFGADTLMIAPFYADNYTLNNSGIVYYKITPTHLIVTWDSVRFSGIDIDGWNNFQLIITDGQDPIVPNGNNISFCYPLMQWACSDSSGGFSGYAGAPATIGINKGNGLTYAQINTISKPGNYYYGPFSADNGIDWLDHKSFTLNSCVNGNAIAPVIYNDPQPQSSTLYICPCDTTSTERAFGVPSPCDTVNLTGAFICATPGQTANLSYSSTGPLNIYAVDTATANYIDSITVQVIPAFGDTGRHTITLTATDPVSHLQSTITYTVVVTVNCLDSPGTPPVAIHEEEIDKSFSVFPNPANTRLTVKLNKGLNNNTAKIYNLWGSEVLATMLISNTTDMDISGLARGIYFIRIFKENTPVATKKIIIQ